MSGPRFDETYTGREFYKVTLPGLVKQLERLCEVLGRTAEQQDRQRARLEREARQ